MYKSPHSLPPNLNWQPNKIYHHFESSTFISMMKHMHVSWINDLILLTILLHSECRRILSEPTYLDSRVFADKRVINLNGLALMPKSFFCTCIPIPQNVKTETSLINVNTTWSCANNNAVRITRWSQVPQNLMLLSENHLISIMYKQ